MPTVARFAITSTVQPAITQSLSIAERFHQGLCSRLKPGEHSPNLTGLDDSGMPLRGNAHVYFLPECDQHGYITHVTLHAMGGFDESACRALGQLNRVWGAEGFDVNVVLLATGHPCDFATGSAAGCPYFGQARVWRSITPFVPVRHIKQRRTGEPKLDEGTNLQIGSAEHDCMRLLKLTTPIALPDLRVRREEDARIRIGIRDIPCMNFQRQRRTGEGIRAGARGYALRIEFDKEVCMPFGLGYGAHFGLGLFIPAE
jgi:CRISPR-associated protein Csb2